MKEITKKILESKKYRAVYQGMVKRLVAVEQVKTGATDLKDVEDRVRSRLHQAWGAYWETRPSFTKLAKAVEAAEEDSAVSQAILGQLLRLHTSTKERLPVLAAWYEVVFSITGIPGSIVDHGCGLMPLSLPFLSVPAYEGITYAGYDIDVEQSAFINRTLKTLAPFYAKHVEARDGDVLNGDYPAADIIFMLKLVPLLEHQTSRAELVNILRKQRCRWLVISYPQHSLGGAKKGMASQYPERFRELAHEVGWKSSTELIVGDELLYIIPINHG